MLHPWERSRQGCMGVGATSLWKVSLPMAGVQNKMIFRPFPPQTILWLHGSVMSNVRGASRTRTYDMRPDSPAAAKQ